MREWTQPIDAQVYSRLRLEGGKSLYKTVCLDPQTSDRYFLKRYRKEIEHRALREELGLTLCAAYGALTPGHTLIYDKQSPILLQRFVPYSQRIGDLYRLAIDPITFKPPDESSRAQLLATLSLAQVTEILICWITDYLTYNWDAHPDNFLIDYLGGSLVGVDKGLTGNFIDHPNLSMESPVLVEGSLIHYVGRSTKPNNHIWGHVYEPVFTNIYRKVYKPDIVKIRSVLNVVESLDHEYDSYICSVLDRYGLEAFIRRREILYDTLTKLFKVLELELL